MLPLVSKIASGAKALKGKGAVDILVGSFATKAAAFLGSIILVRVMAKGEYGALSYMENIYTYAYLFAGYGLNNAVFRYLVLKKTPEERKGVLGYVIAKGTLFNVALVVAVGIVGFLWPHSEGFSMAAYMLPLMLLGIPVQFLFESGTFSLRALFLNRAFAIASVAAVVLVWTLKVLLASSFGLDGAVLSWPLAYGVAAAAVLLYCFMAALGGVRSMPLPKEERRDITAYSLQYMVTNGLWALFMQNDLFMIGLFTGDPAAVADYKVAYVFPMAIGLLSSSIGLFVAPYFVRNETNKGWVWGRYKVVLAVTVVATGGSALAVSVFADPLVGLFYGDQYANIVPLMNMLLIASFVSNGIRYVSANLIAAMGRIKANMVVSACGVVGQIALNIILIPIFGVYGAAITSIVVYSLMAIAITAYFIKTYRA